MRLKHSFTIPLVPPSGNHYKIPVWNQRRFYVTKEAMAFKEAVALFSKRQLVGDKDSTYDVDVTFYLGKKQRLDWDNSLKVLMDGLEDAGVIHSDAAIMQGTVRKRRDWENPRTEVIVRALP